jgi:hypothetical protein
MCKRWLDINKEVSYRKMLSCTNKIPLQLWEHFAQSSMYMGKETGI